MIEPPTSTIASPAPRPLDDIAWASLPLALILGTIPFGLILAVAGRWVVMDAVLPHIGLSVVWVLIGLLCWLRLGAMREVLGQSLDTGSSPCGRT